MTPLQISASLLSADFARLGEEIKAVEPFVNMIHLDVMDGHFVPNISFGPAVISALRSLTSLPFDVHLMISPVDYLINAVAKAGANIITVHPEAGAHIYRTLQKIKAQDCLAGVALNPGTSIEILKPLLPVIDLVLVMTVNPGFGGQAFLDTQLQKIKDIRTLIDETDRKILLQVDGGISSKTAPLVVEAGADILVAGSAIFHGGSDHYEKNVAGLKTVISVQ
ncbi:MAG: ribulose-phosphate 3-epimerase [Alphaproteobacteria bacterium]|nr:ribulose-phosphate 3-epimerase [Alphaproteobacteria bacterium]